MGLKSKRNLGSMSEIIQTTHGAQNWQKTASNIFRNCHEIIGKSQIKKLKNLKKKRRVGRN